MGYVNGQISQPHTNDPKYGKWQQENLMVMSWLYSSMQP